MVFEKKIKSWNETNRDVLEYSRYQYMVEGLKINKEITGLSHYVNDHFLMVLEKKKYQTVVKILECLARNLVDLDWKK